MILQDPSSASFAVQDHVKAIHAVEQRDHSAGGVVHALGEALARAMRVASGKEG